MRTSHFLLSGSNPIRRWIVGDHQDDEIFGAVIDELIGYGWKR